SVKPDGIRSHDSLTGCWLWTSVRTTRENYGTTHEVAVILSRTPLSANHPFAVGQQPPGMQVDPMMGAALGVAPDHTGHSQQSENPPGSWMYRCFLPYGATRRSVALIPFLQMWRYAASTSGQPK